MLLGISLMIVDDGGALDFKKRHSGIIWDPERFAGLLRGDGALDLLKRHSGIVWGPGRFAGLLRGGSVRGLGSRSSPPYFMGGVQARPSLVSRSGNA